MVATRSPAQLQDKMCAFPSDDPCSVLRSRGEKSGVLCFLWPGAVWGCYLPGSWIQLCRWISD